MPEQGRIQVEVRLYALLRRYRPDLRPGQAFRLSLPEGATVKELEEQLGIPLDQVKTVFVNGISRPPEHVLSDGDRVGIFPPVAGG